MLFHKGLTEFCTHLHWQVRRQIDMKRNIFMWIDMKRDIYVNRYEKRHIYVNRNFAKETCMLFYKGPTESCTHLCWQVRRRIDMKRDVNMSIEFCKRDLHAFLQMSNKVLHAPVSSASTPIWACPLFCTAECGRWQVKRRIKIKRDIHMWIQTCKRDLHTLAFDAFITSASTPIWACPLFCPADRVWALTGGKR